MPRLTRYAPTDCAEDPTCFHVLNRLKVSDGSWSPTPGTDRVYVGGSTRGVSFSSRNQQQRPGLTIVTDTSGIDTLYVAFGSKTSDNPDTYTNGWVMGYDPSTLKLRAAFSDTGTNWQGGIWMSGSAPAVDSDRNLYLMTGNGVKAFAASNPATGDLATSIIKLKLTLGASPTLAWTDFFMPNNSWELNTKDADLGSAGPLVLTDTDLRDASGTLGLGPRLLLGGGKEGRLYLVDMDNMGQQSSVACAGSGSAIVCWPGLAPEVPYSLQATQNAFDSAWRTKAMDYWPHIHGTPVYWPDKKLAYVWGERDYLRSFTRVFDPATKMSSLSPARVSDLTTQPVAIAAPNYSNAGGGGALSLSVSTRGEGILWATVREGGADTDSVEVHAGRLYAFDAETFAVLRSFPLVPSHAKFTPPTVFNNKVYVPTFGDPVTGGGAVFVFGVNDRDGDGIPDSFDNCPTAYNPDQSDTNKLAEVVIAQRTDPTATGAAPDGTDPAKTLQWWQLFPGDACDANATTRTSLTQGTNGEKGTCQVYENGAIVPGLAFTCNMVVNTGLYFASWFGNATGTAPPTTPGTSAPSFCKCSEATEMNCVGPPSNCEIANDSAFPTASTLTGKPWQPLTRHIEDSTLADSTFTPMSTQHIQKTRLPSGVPLVRSVWNFRADLPKWSLPATTTTLPGVLWTHVTSFTPAPAAGTPNHYLRIDTDFSAPDVVRITWLPLPVWLPFDIFSVFDGLVTDPPWWSLAPSGPAPGVIEQRPGGLAQLSRRHFSASASALLANIASSSGNLRVLAGDDLLLGRSAAAPAPPSAVVCDRATGHIVGSITASEVQVDGAQVANAASIAWPLAFPSYDAAGNALRDIVMNGPSGKPILVKRDVRSELAGTPNVVMYPLSGDVPQRPRAMVWHRDGQRLLILDEIPDGTTTGTAFVRLLSMTPAGAATELWRTRPSPFALNNNNSYQGISKAFLSITPQGEALLSLDMLLLNGTRTVEAALFDRWGVPVSSLSLGPPGLVGGILATDYVFSVPGENPQSASSLDHSNLSNFTVARSAASTGVCGTTWLKSAADLTTATLLGNPPVDCPAPPSSQPAALRQASTTSTRT